jgi:hypothetical protein
MNFAQNAYIINPDNEMKLALDPESEETGSDIDQDGKSPRTRRLERQRIKKLAK